MGKVFKQVPCVQAAKTHERKAVFPPGCNRVLGSSMDESIQLFTPERGPALTDALLALREGGAEPDELTVVHAFPDKPPVMFRLRARKGGGRGLRVKAPVILEG